MATNIQRRRLISGVIISVLVASCGTSTPTTPPTVEPAMPSAPSPQAVDSDEPSRAQQLRDALDAVISAGSAYERISLLGDADIDLVGRSVCRPARRAAPLDRRESNILAETLMEVFDLSYRDAVVATVMFLSVYCLKVIQ